MRGLAPCAGVRARAPIPLHDTREELRTEKRDRGYCRAEHTRLTAHGPRAAVARKWAGKAKATRPSRSPQSIRTPRSPSPALSLSSLSHTHSRAHTLSQVSEVRERGTGSGACSSFIAFSSSRPCFRDPPRARGTEWRPPTCARRAATAGGAAGSGRARAAGLVRARVGVGVGVRVRVRG